MSVEVWSEPATASEERRQPAYRVATYPTWEAMLGAVPRSDELEGRPIMGTSWSNLARMSDPGDPARWIVAKERAA